MNREEYQRIYQQCWREANKDYIKDYMKWYNEQNPRPKPKKQYVVKDKKHYKAPPKPKEPKEAKPRVKMSNIERIRRKIDLELEKIEARRAEWRAANQQSNIQVEERHLEVTP